MAKKKSRRSIFQNPRMELDGQGRMWAVTEVWTLVMVPGVKASELDDYIDSIDPPVDATA